MVERPATNPNQIFTKTFSGDEYTDYELSDRLHDTYLRPYDDDDILERRLLAPSRVFRKHPEARELVADTLQADDDASIVAAAELLDEVRRGVQPAAETPIGTYLSFITLADDVADVKDKVLGADGPNARANAMLHSMGRRIVADIPDDMVLEYLYTGMYLTQRMRQLRSAPSGNRYSDTFASAKVQLMLSDLRSRYINQLYAEAMPGYDTEPPLPEEVEADTAETTAIFTELRANQQYGIKLGYKPYEYGGSLIFTEPMGADLLKEAAGHPNIHPTEMEVTAVAGIVHSAKRSFKRLRPDVTEIGKDLKGYNFDRLDAITYFHLGPDGELYMDKECSMPLRDTFINKGKYDAYRQLQAGILASYFDMTQPADVVNKVGQAIRSAGDATTADRAEPMAVLRKLVVPRLRYIQAQPESVIQATKDEVAQETQEGTTKVRYHGVTWHRRKLPEGWLASPEAREMAEASGIVLKDNETFVRDHHRGSKKVGEVVAHQLVNKP